MNTKLGCSGPKKQLEQTGADWSKTSALMLLQSTPLWRGLDNWSSVLQAELANWSRTGAAHAQS